MVTSSIEAYLETTQSALLARKNGSSWRSLSDALSVPHGTLHAIGNGKWQHVGWDTVRKVGTRLGLDDPGEIATVLCCPSCGQPHGDGVDCYNRPVSAVVVLGPGERVTAEPEPKPQRARKKYHRPCMDDAEYAEYLAWKRERGA